MIRVKVGVMQCTVSAHDLNLLAHPRVTCGPQNRNQYIAGPNSHQYWRSVGPQHSRTLGALGKGVLYKAIPGWMRVVSVGTVKASTDLQNALLLEIDIRAWVRSQRFNTGASSGWV